MDTVDDNMPMDLRQIRVSSAAGATGDGQPGEINIRKQYFISFFGVGYKGFLRNYGGLACRMKPREDKWHGAPDSEIKNAGTLSGHGVDSRMFWNVIPDDSIQIGDGAPVIPMGYNHQRASS
jgi:hypothetical protein